jgi:hypothetical protein
MVGVDQLEHVTELCDGGNCEEAVLRMWEGMEVEAGKEGLDVGFVGRAEPDGCGAHVGSVGDGAGSSNETDCRGTNVDHEVFRHVDRRSHFSSPGVDDACERRSRVGGGGGGEGGTRWWYKSRNSYTRH